MRILISRIFRIFEFSIFQIINFFEFFGFSNFSNFPNYQFFRINQVVDVIWQTRKSCWHKLNSPKVYTRQRTAVANLVCRTEAPVMKSFHSSKSPFTLLWSSTIYLNLSRHSLNPHQPQLNLKAQCLKITEKVSFNIASEASYVYILSEQKFIKNAKNRQFGKLRIKQCY